MWEMEMVTQVGQLGCLDFLARLDGTLFWVTFWNWGEHGGLCILKREC